MTTTTSILDALDAMGNQRPIYMAGLSGGGWTTTVMTASDIRIARGYSIAGDHPIESVAQEAVGGGDEEQWHEDYPTLYRLAGERLQHIYIWEDPCCFDHISDDIGAPYVTDYTTTAHTISPWAIQWILADIALHTKKRSSKPRLR